MGPRVKMHQQQPMPAAEDEYGGASSGPPLPPDLMAMLAGQQGGGGAPQPQQQQGAGAMDDYGGEAMAGPPAPPGVDGTEPPLGPEEMLGSEVTPPSIPLTTLWVPFNRSEEITEESCAAIGGTLYAKKVDGSVACFTCSDEACLTPPDFEPKLTVISKSTAMPMSMPAGP